MKPRDKDKAYTNTLFKMTVKRILVDNGCRTKIKNLTGASFPTIRKALNGKEDTPLSIRIRKEAINLGGVEKEVQL